MDLSCSASYLCCCVFPPLLIFCVILAEQLGQSLRDSSVQAGNGGRRAVSSPNHCCLGGPRSCNSRGQKQRCPTLRCFATCTGLQRISTVNKNECVLQWQHSWPPMAVQNAAAANLTGCSASRPSCANVNFYSSTLVRPVSAVSSNGTR